MDAKEKPPHSRNIYVNFQNDLPKEEGNLKQIPHKNLSKKEKEAWQSLCQKKNDIIKTKTDEGGAIIIPDVMIMPEKPMDN